MSFPRSVHVTVVAVALLSAACSGSQRRGGGGATNEPQVRSVELAAVDVRPGQTAAPASTAPEGDGAAAAALHALDEKHAAVLQCYTTVLGTAADAAGPINVSVAFGLDGHTQSVSATAAGEGGIAGARQCIEAALREARIEPAPSSPLAVRRTYNFSNPLTNITVSTPLAVTTRRGARPPTAPAAGTEGALTEADVQSVVIGHYADLTTCYTIVQRVVRSAAGTATLVMSVNADGHVAEASVADAQEAISGINECLVTVAQSLQFRTGPNPARIRYPLAFSSR